MDVIRFFDQLCDEKVIRKEGYLATYCFKGHRDNANGNQEYVKLSGITIYFVICMDHVEFQESSESYHLAMSQARREIQEGLRYISVIVKQVEH